MLENTIDERTGRGMYLDIFMYDYNKFEVSKIDSQNMYELAVHTNLEDKDLDELDELEDEEDERVLLEYRRKRIAEIREAASKAKYGDVKEISAQDYVQEVNKAGEDVFVVLHLYKSGYDTVHEYLIIFFLYSL